MREQRQIALIALAALAATALLQAASLWLGDLNQDEGWYLYGAGLVASGQCPYRDFASTQGPVMSYVYALAQPLVQRWGVAGGRAFTGLLGFASFLAAAWLASRLAGPSAAGGGGDASARAGAARAAVLTLLLAGVNVFQCYFGTIVKTYSLAALCLVLGFVALSRAEGRRAGPWALAAGVAMMLAAGTRLSALLAPAATALALLVARGGDRRACGWRAAGFVAGAAIGGAVVFLPFLVAAPEPFWFGVVAYHAGREPGGLLPALAYKGGFVARLGLAYSAALGIALALAGHRLFGARRPPPGPAAHWLMPALWSSVLAVTAVHFAAPFPYDDYQAMIYPLFAVGVGVALERRVRAFWPLPAVAAVCALLALSSPVLQGWFIGPRDRIWWPLKKASPLMVLRATAASLRAQPEYRAGDVLLTQDPYLAVEAGLRLPRGLELGQFSYFPDWEDARADRCRVLNHRGFRELLDTCPAPLAAFSGYGFAIRSPEVQPLDGEESRELWERLERRYARWSSVAPFGQADTELRLYRLRPASGEPAMAYP